MEKQERGDIYHVIYTNPEGEIERVQFYGPCTLQRAELEAPDFTIFGLKKSVAQIEGDLLNTLMSLLNLEPWDLNRSRVYAVFDKCPYGRKVVRHIKPKSKAKPSSKDSSRIKRSPEQKTEKVIHVKPRRGGSAKA